MKQIKERTYKIWVAFRAIRGAPNPEEAKIGEWVDLVEGASESLPTEKLNNGPFSPFHSSAGLDSAWQDYLSPNRLNLASRWERQDNTQEDGDQKEDWKLLMFLRWHALPNNTSCAWSHLSNLEEWLQPTPLRSRSPSYSIIIHGRDMANRHNIQI